MIRATRPSPTDWLAEGVYAGRTTASFLDECAAEAPDADAVIQAGHRIDYRELARQVQQVAAGFRSAGVARGAVVTMQLPNWWESNVVFHALSRLGAVVNPVVPIYRDREIGFIVRQSSPAAIVIPHRFRGFDHVAMVERVLSGVAEAPVVVVVRPDGPLPEGFVGLEDLPAAGERVPAEGDAADIALLLYTSGTTADPKGVLHSHDTLVYEVRSMIEMYDLGPRDTIFMPSPVTHITGFLYGFIMPTMTRAPVVLLDVWEPSAAAEVIEAESCRFTVAATPFLHGLAEVYARRGTPSCLGAFLCGGADVPPALVREATAVLGCDVARVYGSSEFPTFCSGRPGDPPEIAADTDGIPIGPVGWRLDEAAGGIGELLVKGPDLFLGYLDASLNDAAFSADGYFRTGDLASIDERGAVTIRGRQKDIIIRGGENISAKEVEDILFTHPSVKEVAVVAMPDPVMVERVCAFVVAGTAPPPTLDELTAFLGEHRLARQKHPERLELVDALPTTASGKVQKYVLRRLVAERIRDGTSGSDPDVSSA